MPITSKYRRKKKRNAPTKIATKRAGKKPGKALKLHRENMRYEWESIEKVKKHRGIFTKNALTRLDGSKHDNKTQWACSGEQTIESPELAE